MEELKQLEQDLSDLYEKIAAVHTGIDGIRGDYNYKKSKFQDAKMKLDESRHYKEKVKNQMNGFLIMYEVKKEETLRELSKKL